MFKSRIYAAGTALDSTQAIANLVAHCRTHVQDRHQIGVMDVFKDPKRALAGGIFMTPTLIKLAPSPVRRIVCTLSQTQTLMLALGLGRYAA